MKKSFLLVSLIIFFQISYSQDLSYFLPDSVSYNKSIPKPRDIIFHEVGEWHVTHDRLMNYMRAVASAAPDRIRLETMGFTYENRPQVLLIITSAKNHQRLEEIRQQHLLLSDPSRSASVDISNMPAVVYIGHSIHGNEPSGANAALVSAYYLAAAQGKQIEDLLENTVILFDPSFNPDGLQRFSTWVNQHKSKNLVSDPNDREFNEVWPGGRFNHYWFDLNRDWLSGVHVESQNRLKWFHAWKPNVLTDHHEQGSNATFFFQPGVPSRVNPMTAEKNQELTGKLARFHAQFLDRIGSLYFTKENYDDFYYGKGSTFPDIQGAIGILFEQASSRGHLQQTANGILSFPFTIRNQFTATLSTLEGVRVLRKELLEWQREFYKKASSGPLAGYVFGDKYDESRLNLFVEMLQRQQIEVRELAEEYKYGDFIKGKSYSVSLDQPQSTLIKAIFDDVPVYKDSLFYDITSWNMPLAFGLVFNKIPVPGTGVFGKKIGNINVNHGVYTGGKSNTGYLIEWNEYFAPAALFELLNENIIARVTTNPFEIGVAGGNRKFDYGTILVPVSLQAKTPEEIHAKITSITSKYGLKTFALEGGNSISGSDPGSSRMVVLTKPTIAMITGPSVNATDAGEIWHLLDQRMNIPATHLEPSVFNRIDMSRYNTLIIVGGSYTDINKEKLKSWVQAGGVLILTEEAVGWAAQNGISDVKLKKLKSPVDSASRISYIQREQIDGAQQMNGAIFGAEVDLNHPLAYGYHQKTLSLFKGNKIFMEKSRNPYGTPFFYSEKPLQSGWVSRENIEVIKNSAAVIVNTVGSGRVINIADNPNFRAFWLGGSKLFLNAIFFGRIIDAASGRTDD
jgi:hypothetical protein